MDLLIRELVQMGNRQQQGKTVCKSLVGVKRKVFLNGVQLPTG